MKKLFYLLVLATIISCSGDEDSTVPELSTVAVSNITQTTAQSGGAITSNGGAEISSRGIVWSTQQNPTISLTTKTTDGSGDGTFTSSIADLTPETTYFVRAYATNSVGTAYGNEVSFSTGDILLPEITTTEVNDITSSTATSGGNILSNGGGEITERGVVWSTEQNPTINLDTKTVDGSGIGDYTSNLGNLLPATSYYVRAYATNSAGTSYGNEITFITLAVLPSISTLSIENIQNTSAIGGGDVSYNGGSEVTERGVVWSLQQNPTYDLETKTTDGSGSGTFTSNLLGLTPNTNYYVRAYAINDIGIAYGQEMEFTTSNVDYSILYSEDTVFCDGIITEVVDVTNPITGRVWMDRNLGAIQIATSSTDELAYGDLYQWGRGADGHQCRNSEITTVLSSTEQPGHSSFIINTNPSPNNINWLLSSNNSLWQGVTSFNNPCPSGYRIPTETELNEERLSWTQINSTGAFNSTLKFTKSGRRQYNNGIIDEVDGIGSYYSSTTSGIYAKFLRIDSSSAYMNSNQNANGRAVRCIKE